MTTNVTVEAHCDDETEVVIDVTNETVGEQSILKDGESKTVYVYDDLVVAVSERPIRK